MKNQNLKVNKAVKVEKFENRCWIEAFIACDNDLLKSVIVSYIDDDKRNHPGGNYRVGSYSFTTKPGTDTVFKVYEDEEFSGEVEVVKNHDMADELSSISTFEDMVEFTNRYVTFGWG